MKPSRITAHMPDWVEVAPLHAKLPSNQRYAREDLRIYRFMQRFSSGSIPLLTLAIGLFFPLTALAQTPGQAPAEEDCLTGSPNGNFEGDRPVTRYEFAAGLSACLNQLERQLNLENYATKSEVEATTEQQIQLNQELGTLNDRLDALEGESSSAE